MEKNVKESKTETIKSVGEKTIEIWQEKYDIKLTKEHLREITQNLKGFFGLLSKWDKENEQLVQPIKKEKGGDKNARS